jgi:aminocarboxymuconate-semialdehyde decarboxylase
MIPFFWGRINETYAPANQERTIGRVLPKPLYDYFSSFYYDTAVGGSIPAIRCAYEVFGIDQLIFATDAPWGPGTGESRLVNYPKVIKAVGLSDADNRKIFEDNARKILHLV